MRKRNRLIIPIFNTCIAIGLLILLITSATKGKIKIGLLLTTLSIIVIFMFVTWYLGYYKRNKDTKQNPTYEKETIDFINYWKSFSKCFVAEIPNTYHLSFNVEEYIQTIDTFTYDKETHSFTPKLNNTIPLIIGTACIRLEIDLATLKIIGIGGFSPCSIWYKKKLRVPFITKKAEITISSEDIRFGANVLLKYQSDYTTYYDENTGWLVVGNDKTPKDGEVYFLSEQVLVVLHNNNLISCWIKLDDHLNIYQ